jgi:ABC-type sulfate transport system permease component
MEKGDLMELSCKVCNKHGKYSIENIEAKTSKISIIIAGLIFLVGTPLLFVILQDYIFNLNHIYSIVFLTLPIAFPSLVYGIILKNDRQRVKIFNQS